ncbi:uncharacterized protein LOC102804695 [Saccoglossus kowalevskii]|uniref:Uncharacterized protein LOC102804695 n=1 Tax=Saccoglossus kowalevskii TaxID=10224 RepID=A0ABM0M2L8_SACKO|nr:PREDICTED: uncharacterized protein LOC102804695 [Saccoglossus kowalevskii]
MADTSVNGGGSGGNNRKTKNETKSKISKLFRRKNKYKQFDSEVKISTHSKTADYNQQEKNSTSNNWEKLSKLEEHRKGQSPTPKENKDMTKSCKKRHFKDQDNDCVNSATISGTQTATFVEITAEKVEGELVNIGQGHAVIDRDAIHAVSEEHVRKRGDSQVKDDHVLLKERSSYHKMTDITEIEILDENTNKLDESNTNYATKKRDDTTHGKNKWHRSKRFQKLKQKLHLSNYKELYESSETIDNVKHNENTGYSDVRKKKRLKQAGNNVRKALGSGLRNLLEGYQSITPFTVRPSTYHSTDNKNYNPYYTRPHVIPFFA